MMDLVQTWLTRQVQVDINGETVGPFTIRPSTAREAIQILATYQAAAIGDDDAWSAVLNAIQSWLPFRLVSDLRRLSRSNALTVIVDLLSVGLPEVKEQAKKVEEKTHKGGSSWSTVVAEYRHYMGGDLEEPWPFFLDQVLQVDVVKARAEASWMNAYTASRNPKDGPRSRIMERAGLKQKWADQTAGERAAMADKGLDRLLATFQSQVKINPHA